jgi:hypothetical protein
MDSMVRPIDQTPDCLSMKEVAVHAGHQVLEEVDNSTALIVGIHEGF